ncbi:MAG: class I SAM-dependent methyltransferase [Burkholderiales bacterium]
MANEIQPHNQRPAAMLSTGGAEYDKISAGIADSIEHCVLRLDPKPGEYILDLSTGTGWTSRVVARRGARVVGADIAADMVVAAQTTAKAQRLAIEYRLGDAESLPFADGEFDAVASTCGVMFAAARPGPALALRVGADRAHQGAARTRFRPQVREGRVVLSRAQRRGGVEYILDRLWADEIACGQPR